MSMLIAAILIGGFAALPQADGKTCTGPKAEYQGQLDTQLSLLAADAVNRAGRATWKTDKKLEALVAPTADFDLGAGDVGRPLGSGTEGLRALVLKLHADQFRFRGFGGIPMQAQPCLERKLPVEFIDTKAGSSSIVTFTFQNGRITQASGWGGWVVVGVLKPVER